MNKRLWQGYSEPGIPLTQFLCTDFYKGVGAYSTFYSGLSE